jgi:hypothetical protein
VCFFGLYGFFLTPHTLSKQIPKGWIGFFAHTHTRTNTEDEPEFDAGGSLDGDNDLGDGIVRFDGGDDSDGMGEGGAEPKVSAAETLYGHVRASSGGYKATQHGEAGHACSVESFFGVEGAECVYLTVVTLVDGGTPLEGEPEMPAGMRALRLLVATMRVFPRTTTPLSQPRRLAPPGSPLCDAVLERVATVARGVAVASITAATRAFLRDSTWAYLIEGGEDAAKSMHGSFSTAVSPPTGGVGRSPLSRSSSSTSVAGAAHASTLSSNPSAVSSSSLSSAASSSSSSSASSASLMAGAGAAASAVAAAASVSASMATLASPESGRTAAGGSSSAAGSGARQQPQRVVRRRALPHHPSLPPPPSLAHLSLLAAARPLAEFDPRIPGLLGLSRSRASPEEPPFWDGDACESSGPPGDELHCGNPHIRPVRDRAWWRACCQWLVRVLPGRVREVTYPPGAGGGLNIIVFSSTTADVALHIRVAGAVGAWIVTRYGGVEGSESAFVAEFVRAVLHYMWRARPALSE